MQIHEQVRGRMIALVEGLLTREEVADWALPLIKCESARYSSDATLWTALDRLAGADLQQGPGVYLHDADDFQSWLDEFDK
ncbi:MULTISPECIES: hypothetical protein [unclassified Amycolatopsis]|uniref:hypothetical protein n=1 Tax=unclassified Amycolatopsis TaxID=2618356 RepID=UPI001C697E84|nr:hypothetical protein [Amycolatopsis sp. DSM 110486]QYN19226.1 hypothetical protein K1T34_42400 [Amycolatopsis sp. DSM 110486]